MKPYYKTKEDVMQRAQDVLHKTLRAFIPESKIAEIEEALRKYGNDRKGFLGELAETFVFGLPRNTRSEADFTLAGIELKTTPIIPHKTKRYRAKERLVFSMIDYNKVAGETWESSSFLQKNKLLLILFYLYVAGKLIVDYEFKFIHLLDLLSGLSDADTLQIQADWEKIVAKIKRGEAHLLSDADTCYLGACTKGSSTAKPKKQPFSNNLAKPRAFAFKQKYLTILLQEIMSRKDIHSVMGKKPRLLEDAILAKFQPFVGKTNIEIERAVNWHPEKRSKHYKRLLANRILGGSGSNKIAELEKSNTTLRAITLEPSGQLTESISFEAFDYKALLTEEWYRSGDDAHEPQLAGFHAQLEEQRFLFVVFQKVRKSTHIVLKKVLFWNFPMRDLHHAQKVFDCTKDCIRRGDYASLPKIADNPVAHVRPHGRDASDTCVTPQGTYEVKRCFWLNAKYIQKAIEG